MFLDEYYILFILLIACAIFSCVASAKVHSTYAAFSSEKTRSNMTGYDTAVRLLRENGIYHVSVERTKGRLSDHFDPRKKVVRLSESTYGDNSIASVAVAAHEIGHVVQKEKGYLPYRIRTALVPIANIGSFLALPLVIIGVILEVALQNATTDWGYILALVGVAFYGASTLFTLVTLPVELDASKRARKMLIEEGILNEEEIYGAKRVLSAAAMTYVAALATSLVYFLRFAIWALSFFARNRD